MFYQSNKNYLEQKLCLQIFTMIKNIEKENVTAVDDDSAISENHALRNKIKKDYIKKMLKSY